MTVREIALVALLPSATSILASDYYKLQMVKRVDQNLYSATSGSTKVLIETRYCYEHVMGVDAVLKYSQYAYDNKIIFEDDASCDVVPVTTR